MTSSAQAMILLLVDDPADSTVTDVTRELHRHGADVVVLSPEVMSGLCALSIQPGGSATLRIEDRLIDVASVHSAWLWRPWYAYPAHDPRLARRFRTDAEREFFLDEWHAFYKGLAMLLAHAGTFCVNPPPFNVAFEEKCCQMMLAAQVGLTIPDTLYTTRLPLARRFHDAHGGDIIYKSFRGVGRVTHEDETHREVDVLYTSRVQAAHLVEAPGFVPSPAIFQPYVPKQLELRVVIFGRRVLACAIHSQQSERSRDDWRRYDFDNTPYAPYALPEEVSRKLVALLERMGLVYASIDLILTPDNEFVFLEVNPNGQFAWVADRSGLPLFAHMAAMLMAASVDYALPG